MMVKRLPEKSAQTTSLADEQRTYRMTMKMGKCTHRVNLERPPLPVECECFTAAGSAVVDMCDGCDGCYGLVFVSVSYQ